VGRTGCIWEEGSGHILNIIFTWDTCIKGKDVMVAGTSRETEGRLGLAKSPGLVLEVKKIWN
jgi:hypothetical protein